MLAHAGATVTVLFHNDFPLVVGEQPEQRILAHNNQLPVASQGSETM